MSAPEQLDLFGIAKGEKMMADARRWKVDNYGAYQWMLRHAKADAARGEQISVSYYAETIRREHLYDKPDKPFAVNNSLRAPIARLLVNEAPEIAKHIDMRSSWQDVYLGVVRR
jgi:hypothetical protein